MQTRFPSICGCRADYPQIRTSRGLSPLECQCLTVGARRESYRCRGQVAATCRSSRSGVVTIHARGGHSFLVRYPVVPGSRTFYRAEKVINVPHNRTFAPQRATLSNAPEGNVVKTFLRDVTAANISAPGGHDRERSASVNASMVRFR